VIKFKTTTTTTKNTANEVEPIWVLSGAATASSGVRPTFKLNSRMQVVLNDPAHELSVSNQSSDQFMAVLVCGARDCKLDCVDPGEGKRASCSSSATALRDAEGSCSADTARTVPVLLRSVEAACTYILYVFLYVYSAVNPKSLVNTYVCVL
jgi:hypothetical protein